MSDTEKVLDTVLPKLQKLSWRVDEKTDESFVTDEERVKRQAVALMELKLENETVRFEMDTSQVNDVLSQLERVSAKLESISADESNT